MRRLLDAVAAGAGGGGADSSGAESRVCGGGGGVDGVGCSNSGYSCELRPLTSAKLERARRQEKGLLRRRGD